MEIPNQVWTAIVTKAGADVQSLYDSATVKQVCIIDTLNSDIHVAYTNRS